MTKNYVGEFTLSNENEVSFSAQDIKVPEKKEWNHFSIWQFNGKQYRPLTKLAEDNLDAIVKKLESAGFKAATKDGKRKSSSLKYAIITTGVEDFYFI